MYLLFLRHAFFPSYHQSCSLLLFSSLYSFFLIGAASFLESIIAASFLRLISAPMFVPDSVHCSCHFFVMYGSWSSRRCLIIGKIFYIKVHAIFIIVGMGFVRTQIIRQGFGLTYICQTRWVNCIRTGTVVCFCP